MLRSPPPVPSPAGAAQGLTPAESLADLLQAYLDDSRLFLEALEELQGQLGVLEEYRTAANLKESAVLRRVAEKAPSAAFTAYLASTTVERRQRPDLAQQIDDNLRLLRVLSDEMRGQVAAVEEQQAALQRRMTDAVAAADPEALPGALQDLPAVDVNLVAASVADGLRADVDLIGRVAGGVALGTPAEQVASYVTLLRIQPHLSEVLLAEALSWRRRQQKEQRQ